MLELVAIWALLAAQAPDLNVLREIQRSHIEANVPPPAEFNRLLQRDLNVYFRAKQGKAVQVKYEMLRDGPTQSGVAYPKFYVWVRVLETGSVAAQGAVRLAAIERKKFEVMDFVTEQAIRDDPTAIYRVFPAPVCDRIKARLAISQ